MADLEISKTLENLKEAFAGESQANRKYLAFAEQADADGYPQVAKLFRAAAEAETVHAHAHLRAMEGVGSTKDNLLAAVEGETYEFESMYPGMIAEAKKEGFKKAERSFNYANQVERIHAGLYQKALKNLGAAGMKGLVLDLRDNPGGYLEAAVEAVPHLRHPSQPLPQSRLA